MIKFCKKIAEKMARLLPMSDRAPFSISSDGNILYFLNQEVPRRNLVDPQVAARVPSLEKILRTMVMDQSTVEIVSKLLGYYKVGANPLLEGPTAAAKTTGPLIMSALLGQPVWRVNHSGDTDSSDTLGRFVPNAADGQSQLFALIHAKDITKFKPETQAILAKYRYKKGNTEFISIVSAADRQKLVELENIQISDKPFSFSLGSLPTCEYYGGTFIADELNLAQTDIQSGYNAPLEKTRTTRIPGAGITMSIFGQGREKVDPHFFFVGTQNPIEYGQRKKQPADLLRRLEKNTIEAPSQKQLNEMIAFYIHGIQPEVVIDGTTYQAEPVQPLYPQLADPKLVPFFGLLANFHHSLQVLCSAGVLCANRKQKLVFTRREIIAFMDLISRFESYNRASGERDNFQTNPVEIFFRMIDLFYTNRFQLDEDDRAQVAEIKLKLLGVVDRDFYLTKFFGNDLKLLEDLFENPFSANLIFKSDAEQTLEKINLEKKLLAVLKKLNKEAQQAKLSQTKSARDFYAGLIQPKKVNQFVRPAIEVSPDGKYLYVHDQILLRRDPATLSAEEKKHVPTLAASGNLCRDKKTMELLTLYAIAAKYDLPVLVEGMPATTKTAGPLYLAAHLNQPLRRINYNGRTDPADLIGRYVPADQPLAERYLDILHLSQDLLFTEESGQLLAQAKLGNRDLSLEEAKKIAELEGLEIPPLSWKFLEEDLIAAARQNHWVEEDEVNQAETNVNERFNSLLERDKSIMLSEHNGELLSTENGSIGELFRIFGTMNPAEFPGKKVFSPAAINRWPLYTQINNVSAQELEQMLQLLVYGLQPELEIGGIKYGAENQTSSYPKMAHLLHLDRFFIQLAEFHAALSDQVNPILAKRQLAQDEPELQITRSELIKVLDRIEKGERSIRQRQGSNIVVTKYDIMSDAENRKKIITEAISEVYLTKFKGEDKEKVKILLEAKGLTSGSWDYQEIEPLMSGAEAVAMLDGKYLPAITALILSVNTNPNNRKALEDALQALNRFNRELTDLEHNLIQEAHTYQVQEDPGVKQLLAIIAKKRKQLEQTSDIVNIRKDEILDQEITAQALTLEQNLTGVSDWLEDKF